MPFDDGDEAIIKNLIRDEITVCPIGKANKDEVSRVDKRVDQMQYEVKTSMTNLSDKVDANNKETNNRWFTVLMAILGNFLALLVGLLFIALKLKGVS